MKTEHPSVCPLDCPDTCSLTVTVEAERVVNIRGSRANPYTDGVLCAKVPRAYPEFVHGERRLLTPLRRLGARGEGKFARISWDGGTRRDPPPGQRGHRRARPAGGDAVQLRGAARPAGGRLDGPALLPSAGRHHARPQAPVRRHPHRGVGGNLRHHARHPPRAGRAVEADRGVGQQRHLVEPAPHADHQPGSPGRRQAGRGRSAPREGRRAGRPAPGPAPGHRRGAGVGDRGRAGASRRPRPRVHRALGGGLRRLHGPGAAMDARAGGRDVRSARGRRGALRRVVRDHHAGVDQRGQRPGAQPQRRQRHPRGAGAAGAGRAVRRRRRWSRQRGRVRVSQDAAEAGPAGPGAGRHPHAEHRRHRPPPDRGNAGAAPPGAVHLQPQPGRRAPRSEPHAPGARARGPLHRRDRGRHDRQHAVLRHRATGLDQLRVPRPLRRLRPALAAARRAGHPTAGRVAAEHRDLPPAGPRASATRSPSSRPPTPS